MTRRSLIELQVMSRKSFDDVPRVEEKRGGLPGLIDPDYLWVNKMNPDHWPASWCALNKLTGMRCCPGARLVLRSGQEYPRTDGLYVTVHRLAQNINYKSQIFSFNPPIARNYPSTIMDPHVDLIRQFESLNSSILRRALQGVQTCKSLPPRIISAGKAESIYTILFIQPVGHEILRDIEGTSRSCEHKNGNYEAMVLRTSTQAYLKLLEKQAECFESEIFLLSPEPF